MSKILFKGKFDWYGKWITIHGKTTLYRHAHSKAQVKKIFYKIIATHLGKQSTSTIHNYYIDHPLASDIKEVSS